MDKAGAVDRAWNSCYKAAELFKMLIYRIFATLYDLSSDGPFKILSRRLAESGAKKTSFAFLNLFLFSAIHLLNYKQTAHKIWDFKGYQIQLQRYLSTLHLIGIQG